MTSHGKFGHLTDEEFVSQMRSRAGASPVIAETLSRLESNLDSSAKAAEDLRLLVEAVEWTTYVDGVDPLVSGASSVLGIEVPSTPELENMDALAKLKRLLELVPQLVEAVRTKKEACPVCEAKIG